jgi:hypothetical protein
LTSPHLKFGGAAPLLHSCKELAVTLLAPTYKLLLTSTYITPRHRYLSLDITEPVDANRARKRGREREGEREKREKEREREREREREKRDRRSQTHSEATWT